MSEVRLENARTLEDAEAVLLRFLPRYNRRFVVPATEPGSAYSPVDPGLDLATVFCLKHMRTAGRDNVVQFQGRRLQILPSHGRTSYARTRLEIHERMDGTLAVYHQGLRLRATTAPLEAPGLRADAAHEPQPASPTPHYRTPAPNHP